MLNFASLFNQFRSQTASSLSDLLEKSTTKMDRLLDEDSFLNEYKSGNPRAIEFMKYDKYQELIQFITIVGPADDKKRSYKYPLSACQLLSIDNNTAIEFFFPEKTLTVDEKIIEEVETQVEVEVEQSPESSSNEKEQPEKNDQTEKTIIKDTLEIPKQAQDVSNEIEEITTDGPQSPPKKKTKTIKQTQLKKVEKITKREVEPLIGKIMSYFNGQVNYTLAGYICKVLTVFCNKKPNQFIKYLLQQNVIQSVLDHAESRSVGELIMKVLVHESTIELERRRQVFGLIMSKLSNPSQIHIMSNISSYVCEIIEKVATNLKGPSRITDFSTVFFSLEVITQVIRNVISQDESVSVYNAPVLFSYLTNVPFVLPEDPIILDQFKLLLKHFIDKSVQKLTTNNVKRPKLGTGRVKIVEIMRFLIKENLLNCRDLFGQKQDFFDVLINLFKNYEMNNVLHNQIIKIIEVALAEPSTLLGQLLLKDKLLIKFIADEASEDKKIKAGVSSYKQRKGYIAHVINLCLKIRELSQKNELIQRFAQSTEFCQVFENFIQKEVFNHRRTLAGFAMRKDIKHEIMFQKEDIIASYLTFFQKCPSPIFEQQSQHINIEHPDLIEQLQQELESSLTVKKNEPQRADIQVESEAKDEPAVSAQVIYPSAYFTVHMNYDVDELLLDL